jgi:LmbE family N-acetylglucosaminyl deacetylase
MTTRAISSTILLAALFSLPAVAQLMQPLPEDRGAAALSLQLKRLQTWGSILAINAHPDDEDGAMLTYESRGQGVRTMLVSLTRGEGGQNTMSADSYDALGLLRTQELIRAAAYYGAEVRWGTVADFGFSKTQEESFDQWGHDRVLCDAVAAVRRFRPLVITSSFVGGTTDGHGHHQVAGEIAQEVFNAAGDATVCPDPGLAPWKPLKVYARVPTFSITEKGMFDYATGQWAPVLFKNYITGEGMHAAPATNVVVETGGVDPVLGRSYAQIAREGWDQQRTQNGGGFLALPGEVSSEYHLYASRVGSTGAKETSFFDGIDTSLMGLAKLSSAPPTFLLAGLTTVSGEIEAAQSEYKPTKPEAIAPHLHKALDATIETYSRLCKARPWTGEAELLCHELWNKRRQLNDALALALSLDVNAWVATTEDNNTRLSYDEAPRTLLAGQQATVRVHATAAPNPLLAFSNSHLVVPQTWQQEKPAAAPATNPDARISIQIPPDAAPTAPYFHRDSIESPYYEISDESLRGESWTPYPLQVQSTWIYDGASITITRPVVTAERVNGEGMVLEPAVIAPALSLSVTPSANFIISGNTDTIPVTVRLHAEKAIDGEVHLKLSPGWSSTPGTQKFLLKHSGEEAELSFTLQPPADTDDKLFRIQAEAVAEEQSYTSAFERIGYEGITPSYRLRPAEVRLRSIDLKLPRERSIGYVMGTGDELPAALTALGFEVHLLNDAEIAGSDLSHYSTILVGIRAYSSRAELRQHQERLMDYVQKGGNLVVEYQSEDFPAPYPLSLGRSPEKVVEEAAPVKLLEPTSPLLNSPNRITTHDFDNWVEERGHSFLTSWDNHYAALTETADKGQAPQRGGLVTTQFGQGRYIYMSFALYRQLPELVPGACRLLVNLLNPVAQSEKDAVSK